MESSKIVEVIVAAANGKLGSPTLNQTQTEADGSNRNQDISSVDKGQGFDLMTLTSTSTESLLGSNDTIMSTSTLYSVEYNDTVDLQPTPSPSWQNYTATEVYETSTALSFNATFQNCTFYASTLPSTIPLDLNVSIGSTTQPPSWNISTTQASLSEAEMPHMMSTTEAILTLFPLALITLAIIIGNLLVVIAVFTKRSLRTPQNIYIVSLALTDMTVALIVLPYNMATLVLQKWIFGDVMCKIYLTMDVSLCCVSIFHLCAIGIDRYRAITDGIHYVQKRNLRSVLINILFLWVIALWIGSPTLLALKDWEIRYDGISCEMSDSPGFNIHLAIGGLFFPLVIMSVIYTKIYYAIQERLRERARVTCMELTSDADTTDRLDETKSTVSENGQGNKKGGARRKPSAQISTFLVNKQKFSLSKERKAAKTLGIIMAAFVICWLPLGFLNVIGSLCPDGMKPHPIWFHTFTWLGYINSGLNPIIYGVSNQEYQKAFRRILRLD